MTIRIKLELASGQSLAGMALQVLRDGQVIGQAKVPAQGPLVLEVPAAAGQLAVRADRSQAS